MGVRAWGFKFRVSGVGFQASGFGFRVSGFGLQISGFGSRSSIIGFREYRDAAPGGVVRVQEDDKVSGFRSRVSSLGFRISAATLEATPGQITSRSPTDATTGGRF